MKVLFVMHYPGYLRHFDSTVHGLAERGHTVYLAFNNVRKMAECLESLDGANERVVMLGGLPKRRDRWAAVVRGVRVILDYTRYLHPRYRDAQPLRRRFEPHLPQSFRFLTRMPTLPEFLVRGLVKALSACEAAVPSNRDIEAFIETAKPDVVLVTPLVTDGSAQTDVVKSAQALGIRTGLCVGSWDHLTTKGLVRVVPDLVVVWNELQKAEAVEFHSVPPERIEVTGAQTFEHWTNWLPSTTREQFCVKVGLSAEQPFLLYVGSMSTIAATDAELRFVRKWISALRQNGDQLLNQLGVLIRPHPYNLGIWVDADLSDLGNVAIYPRTGANPVNAGDRADYFDSIWHSQAVVGINTSAMVEAAIVGRSVLTVTAPEFADTQGGTLHFRYLAPEHGGFLRAATSLAEHVQQLSETIAKPEVVQQEMARFVGSFVFPRGTDRTCTSYVVEAVERLGRLGPRRPRRTPRYLYPLRWLLAFIAVGSCGNLAERTVAAFSETLHPGLVRTGKPPKNKPMSAKRIGAAGKTSASPNKREKVEQREVPRGTAANPLDERSARETEPASPTPVVQSDNRGGVR